MKVEKCLITNLKINDLILDQKENLCILTMVSQPKKAGKHGSAKVFYNYIVYDGNSKVQTVGKSRDEVTKVSINKAQAEKVLEDDLQVSFVDSSSGNLFSFEKKNLINLNLVNKKEEITNLFFYFIYKDNVFFQNK